MLGGEPKEEGLINNGFGNHHFHLGRGGSFFALIRLLQKKFWGLVKDSGGGPGEERPFNRDTSGYTVGSDHFSRGGDN